MFVNRFFYPDHSATSQMLSDLAFGLAERGHKIAIITSRLDYDRPGVRLPEREQIRGVDVIRISTTGFGRSNLLGRTIDYATFYLALVWNLWRHVRAGDLVMALTDPPLISIVTTPMAKWRGAKAGNWLQDIFPEIATALGVGQGRLQKWGIDRLRRWRNASLRRSALNVVIGDRMAAYVRNLGVSSASIRTIPNWSDGALIAPVAPSANALRQAWGLADDFVVGYSGNLGRAHDHATILGAMNILARQDFARSVVRAGAGDSFASSTPDARARPISWLFIGGGVNFAKLRNAVDPTVPAQFHPYQPRTKLAESLSVPDVHLISLRPELEGLIVPSKVYGIAAAGRPAIFIGDPEGEIAQLLTREGMGFVVAQGDSEGLARILSQFARDPKLAQAMGGKARDLFEKSADLPHALTAWESALASLN